MAATTPSLTFALRFRTLSPLMHGDHLAEEPFRLANGQTSKRTFQVVRRLTATRPGDPEKRHGAYEQFTFPVVSGNALGGIWRRLLRDAMLTACGLTQADFRAATHSRLTYHLFSSGGGLEGRVSLISPDLEDQIRAVFPELGLFGGSYQSDMIHGHVKIGFAYPAAESLTRLLPGIPDLEPLGPDLESLVATGDDRWVQFRHPDTHLVELPDAPATANADGEENAKAAGRAMPVDSEYVLPGTPFVAPITLFPNATPLERSALGYAIHEWARPIHAFLGGRSRSGMGRVAVTPPQAPELDPSLYAQFLVEKADERRQLLTHPKVDVIKALAGKDDVS